MLSKSAVDSRLDIQNSIARTRLRASQDSWFTGVWYRTRELWKANLGGSIVMAPITYRIDGQQYVSVISGHTLVTFALRN